MTDFSSGDMVSPRKYVIERYPAYAGQVGQVVGTRDVGRKTLIDVEWLDGLAQTEWPASYLKLVTGGPALVALRAFENSHRAAEDGIASDDDGEYGPETIPPTPRGDYLDTSGFVPPETQSDDVRAGRVILDVNDAESTVTVTLGDQEVTVDGEGDEVKPQPIEPTYGPCNGYRCPCDDWVLGKKVGGLAVCATCTHTMNTHKVPTHARVAKRGTI